jgi:hypothetical protein
MAMYDPSKPTPKPVEQYGKARPKPNSFMQRIEAAGKDPANKPTAQTLATVKKILAEQKAYRDSQRVSAGENHNIHPDFGSVGSETGNPGKKKITITGTTSGKPAPSGAPKPNLNFTKGYGKGK